MRSISKMLIFRYHVKHDQYRKKVRNETYSQTHAQKYIDVRCGQLKRGQSEGWKCHQNIERIWDSLSSLARTLDHTIYECEMIW